MPKKTARRASKPNRGAAGSSKSKESVRADAENRAQRGRRSGGGAGPTPTNSAAVRQRFVNDLLVRGEAKKRDKHGRVPLDATHAITKENPDGSVEVERVRFKVF